MSTLAERFRELDRADIYARLLGRDDPSELAAWDAVRQLVEDLHGDPRDTAPRPRGLRIPRSLSAAARRCLARR